jgi:RND family efflux transporter MFP subunit
MKWMITAGAVGLVLLLTPYGSSSLTATQTGHADSGARPTPITVVTASLQPVEEALHAFGHVRPSNVITLATPRTPAPVAALLVHEGALVRQGEVLAQLETDEALHALLLAQGELQSAMAEVAEARSLVQLAKTEVAQRNATVERLSQLAQKGASSDVQRVDALRALERAALDAEARQSRLEQALVKAEMLRILVKRATTLVDEMTIVAPVAGRVMRIEATPGATPAPGTALISLAQGDRMEAVLQVPPGRLARVQVGHPVQLWLADGLTTRGAVTRIAPGNSDRAGLAEVTVALEDDVPSVAGSHVRGQIITDRRMAMLIPASALVQLPSGPGVLRIVDGRAVATPVAITAGPDGNLAEIKDGLPEGATIATLAGSLLRDGSPVQPVQELRKRLAWSDADARIMALQASR